MDNGESDLTMATNEVFGDSSEMSCNTQSSRLGPKRSVNSELLLDLVESLKGEISALKVGLEKSEKLRKRLELRLAQKDVREFNWSLSEVQDLDNTRLTKDPEDNNMGLLWNLSSENNILKAMDEELGKLEHSSRCPEEHPVVIVSDTQLEMVSFPMSDNMKSSTERLSEVLHTRANMMGHMKLSRNEVEVTAGFAGAVGNLIWFNTGGCALLLRLSTGGESKSIILEHGFGFA